MRKLIRTALPRALAAVIALLAAAAVSAAPAEADGVYIIDGYSELYGWKCPEGQTISVSAEDGERKLVINGKGAPGSDTVLHAEREYENKLDLFYYDSISVDITPEADGAYPAVIYAMVVTADGYEVLGTAAVSCGETARIIMDISGLSGRESVSNIIIECTVSVPAGAPSGRVSASAGSLSAAGKTDSGRSERFFCSDYNVSGGSMEYSEDGSECTFTVSENDAYMEGNVTARPADVSTNALRIRLDNATRNTSVTVFWTYDENGEFRDSDSVTVKIERTRGKMTYIFPVEHPESIKRLRIRIDGNSKGSIFIYSVGAVSTYVTTAGTIGEISDCRVSDDGNYIIIRGTVPSATVSSNKGKKLALYELSPYESLSDVADIPAPTALHDMSSRFEFRLPISAGNASSVYSKFAVVLYDGGVTDPVIPIDSVKCVSGTEAAPDSAGGTLPAVFKGISVKSADITAAADGYGTLLIDVDLSRLASEGQKGCLYYSGGKSYYFDSDYLAELDSRVRTGTAYGGEAVFRLLASNPGRAVPFTFSYDESGVYSYALCAMTDEGIAYIRAVTLFLIDRYSQSARIGGFVLGTCINESGEYNYMGAGISLDDYAENYLDCLRVIYSAAVGKNGDYFVCVPFSDKWQTDGYGRGYLSPTYDSMLLLEALSARAYDEGGIEYLLLWESSRAPDTAGDGSYITAADITVLTEFMEGIGEGHLLPLSLIYLWNVSGTGGAASPAAAYAYTYYTLFSGGKVSRFIISLTDRADSSRELVRLRSVAAGIDTADAAKLTASLAAEYGAVGFYAITEGYDQTLLPVYARQSLAAAQEAPAFTGAFDYFTFGEDTDIFGYSGNLLSSAGVGKTADGTVYLGAVYDGEGDRTLLYRYDKYEDLVYTPVIYADLSVTGEGEYTVTLSCGAGSSRADAVFTVTGGERSRVYMDLSGFAERIHTEYFCITVSGGSGKTELCLYALGGVSSQMNDEALARAIETKRGEIANSGSPVPYTKYIWMAAVAAVVIGSAVIAVIQSRKRGK